MLERTISLCRRLIGKRPKPEIGGGTAVQDDRRLWVRYEPEAQAEITLAPTDRPERVTAQVRNVSVGGANLLAERGFAPGRILSLELSGGGEEQIVLACVVRADALGNGQWSIGCTFSRELAAADLTRFGVRRTEPGSDEQRGWARHQCTLTANYQRIGEDDNRSYAARVLNISVSGIGLVLTDPVEVGSLINVGLHNAQGRLVRTILACVVHSTLRTSGELVVGCNFIRELAEDELQGLL